jgi:hypothetical protein
MFFEIFGPMRLGPTFFLAYYLCSLSLVCSGETPNKATADDLILEKIAHPGTFSQMCALPCPIPRKVPLPLYSTLRFRELALSTKDLDDLRARRSEVVPALKERLASLDFSKEPPAAPKISFKPDSEDVENSGANPLQLNSLYYDMILGLDAVEVLPELLRLEDRLHSLLIAAQRKPTADPPHVEKVWAPITDNENEKELPRREEDIREGTIVQREILSVMMTLLRQQRFEALLKTDFEQKYATALKARAQKEDLREIRTPEDAKKPGKEWVRFDPIYNIPIGYIGGPDTSVPYSEELRNKVRGLVEQFIKAVPPKDWKIAGQSQ